MQSKRTLFTRIAERRPMGAMLRALHTRGRHGIVILAYHRVVPLDVPENYPLDLHLISATPDEFRSQMAWIRRSMNPVSLTQLLAHLEGHASLPPAAVAVTFDDGFQDTYVHAFPILREFIIPATVFVTTGNVESGLPFWFEIIACLMMRLPPGSINVPEVPGPQPSGDSANERRLSTSLIQSALKRLPNARRTALMATLTQRFSQLLKDPLFDTARSLDWPQIREMAANGIEFGSHSVSHPNLTQLGDAELMQELIQSRSIIEREAGIEVKALAYPLGTRQAYDERIMQHARDAGYAMAMTYVHGMNWLHRIERFEMRRQGVSLGTSPPLFRALLDFPDWIA